MFVSTTSLQCGLLGLLAHQQGENGTLQSLDFGGGGCCIINVFIVFKFSGGDGNRTHVFT